MEKAIQWKTPFNGKFKGGSDELVASESVRRH